MFPEVAQENERQLIWAVAKDGSLYVAEDIKEPVILGHPSMTGMQLARIAGEMLYDTSGGAPVWTVNAESGRYSRDYEKADHYLNYAVRKIRLFFSDEIQKVEEIQEVTQVSAIELDTPLSGGV